MLPLLRHQLLSSMQRAALNTNFTITIMPGSARTQWRQEVNCWHRIMKTLIINWTIVMMSTMLLKVSWTSWRDRARQSFIRPLTALHWISLKRYRRRLLPRWETSKQSATHKEQFAHVTKILGTQRERLLCRVLYRRDVSLSVTACYCIKTMQARYHVVFFTYG